MFNSFAKFLRKLVEAFPTDRLIVEINNFGFLSEILSTMYTYEASSTEVFIKSRDITRAITDITRLSGFL